MKILITGGQGFIGGYLSQAMRQKGWEVLAPGKEWLDVKEYDTFDAYREIGIDVVVHLAAKLMIHDFTPQQYFDTNTLGTFNVLEFCRTDKIPSLIYAMTHSDTNLHEGVIYPYNSQVYGTGSWEHNAIPFIQSKVAAADMVEAYNRQKAVKGFILRLSNIRGFGSNDTRYNSPFHQFIDKARKGDPIEVWGNPPKTRRDFVYIKDVCEAMIAVASNSNKGIPSGYYNVGAGKAITIKEEIEAICKVFCPEDKKSVIIERPDIEETRKVGSLFNISKITTYAGWLPHYSYVAALEDYKREACW